MARDRLGYQVGEDKAEQLGPEMRPLRCRIKEERKPISFISVFALHDLTLLMLHLWNKGLDIHHMVEFWHFDFRGVF
jgi:hypothetical protein